MYSSTAPLKKHSSWRYETPSKTNRRSSCYPDFVGSLRFGIQADCDALGMPQGPWDLTQGQLRHSRVSNKDRPSGMLLTTYDFYIIL